MGLSKIVQAHNLGRYSSTHYRFGRHDAQGKTDLSETTQGMEMHGQMGGTRRTREKLEDQRPSGFAIFHSKENTARPQESVPSKGYQNHGRCQAQSKQPLGQ